MRSTRRRTRHATWAKALVASCALILAVPLAASAAPVATVEPGVEVGTESSAPETTTAPEAIAPAPEVPAVEAPAADAPVADAPGTDVPATDAPANATGFAPLAVGDATAVLTKDSTLDGTLTPGEIFKYQFSIGCSGPLDCVGLSFEDVIPAELEVIAASIPADIAGKRDVTFDAATNMLTIDFVEPTTNPVGVGMVAGSDSLMTFDLLVRLPLDTTLTNDDEIVNKARVFGDNLPEEVASQAVVADVEIPRIVNPVATKSWAPASAIAGSETESVITLGIRNASSSSTKLTSLTLTDETPSTWDYQDFEGAQVAAFPAGANSARLLVKTAAGWSAPGAATTAAGPLALPAGVSAADVIGVQVVFTDSGGAVLPYQASGGGSVTIDVELRDTVRSTGADTTSNTNPVNISNVVTPSGADSIGSGNGSNASAPFAVQPATLSLGTSKTFTRTGGGAAIDGQNSPVTATINAQNNSAFAIGNVTITEPAASTPGAVVEWDKWNKSSVDVVVPAGATAVLSVNGAVVGTYASGTTTTVPLVAPVNEVSVSYTGTIAPGAVTTLRINGNLNGNVTIDDVDGGSSAGVFNRATVTASAPTGGGTFTGQPQGAVRVLPANGTGPGNPGGGTPVGVGTSKEALTGTAVYAGQNVVFRVTGSNSSNVVLSNVVVTDPIITGGVPATGASNPFTYLNLVGLNVTGVPASLGTTTIEVYVGSAWQVYTPSAPVPAGVMGVRASFSGTMDPGATVRLELTAQRKSTAGNTTAFDNCATTTGTGYLRGPDGTFANRTVTSSHCIPLTLADGSGGATVNKAIEAVELPVYSPGLPQQTTKLQLRLANAGASNATQLVVTDQDADFFASWEVLNTLTGKTPTGADQVRIDAFVGGVWVPGLTTAVGSGATFTPTLPAGVLLPDITGVRLTFSSTTGVMTPCGITACEGWVDFTIAPRLNAGVAVYENTARASYSLVEEPNVAVQIAPVSDSIALVEGKPVLNAIKDFDTVLRPGETTSFTMSTTNSGTSGAPNPSIVDLLPPQLDMVEPSAYTWEVTGLPAGYTPAPVPTPSTAFTATGTLERLSLTFEGWTLPVGATIKVTLNGITLAPGAQAGTQIVNWVGTSSTHPQLTCVPAPATGVRDYGDNTLYCEDPATVDVESGSAFQARKWVGSTEATGWHNLLTGTDVPVGDSSCPSLDVAGLLHTMTPCVVLVESGAEFQWLLRVVNAGTEFASRVTIIDNHAGLGDQTVVGGAPRDSQWTPVVTGVTTDPAATVSSTNGPVNCTSTVLRHDTPAASGCGGTSWTAGYAGSTLKIDWTFPDGSRLAPAAGVQAIVTATALSITPADGLVRTNNTFAHVETTYNANTGGVIRYLPGFETKVTSVASVFGSFEIRKVIGDNPAGVPTDGVPYGLTYICTDGAGLTTNGTGTFTVQESFVSPMFPVGTECEVWESDANGGTSTNPVRSGALTFEITRDELGVDPEDPTVYMPDVDLTITNDFPASSLLINKLVTGPGAAAFGQGPFTFQVVCTLDGVEVYTKDAVTVTTDGKEGSSELLTPIPVGAACVITETDAAGADAIAAPVTVTVGVEPTTAEVTNHFSAGTVWITKVVDGSAADLAKALNTTYEFSLLCSFPNSDMVIGWSLTAKAGEKVTVRDANGDPVLMPVGMHCSAQETQAGGATSTVISPAVTVEASDSAEAVGLTITATNTFDQALLTVSKTVVNGKAGPYEFTALCTVPAGKGGAAVAGAPVTFNLSHGESKQIRVIEGSACTVTEKVVSGAKVTIADSDGIATDGVVNVKKTATVAFTNTFAKLPSTGADGATQMALGGLTLLLLGAGAFVASRRRREG